MPRPANASRPPLPAPLLLSRGRQPSRRRYLLAVALTIFAGALTFYISPDIDRSVGVAGVALALGVYIQQEFDRRRGPTPRKVTVLSRSHGQTSSTRFEAIRDDLAPVAGWRLERRLMPTDAHRGDWQLQELRMAVATARKPLSWKIWLTMTSLSRLFRRPKPVASCSFQWEIPHPPYCIWIPVPLPTSTLTPRRVDSRRAN